VLSAEKFFRHAPRPIKDAICTLYGLRIHRRRYGPQHEGLVRGAAKEERLEPGQLEQKSIARLRATLVLAGREVPYYRELFAGLKIDPKRLELPGELRRIPILEKATVRERAEEFLSDAVRGKTLETRETSGTTGSPLSVRADLPSLRRHYAIYDRFRQWAGSALGRRRATFNGRVLWPANRLRPPFWVRDLTENNTLFSVYHMTPATLPRYVKQLRRWSPHEIHAYPSALVTLARFAAAEGLELPRPATIITSAETLSPTDRELLEQAFACKLFDQYGNAEMTIFAGQCEQGRMHLNSGYSHVEIVDERGVEGAVRGEAITTGFVNRAMPLIRYRVGDTLSVTGENCPCGRSYPVLGDVVGRTDDLLILPDGRIVGRLDPVFKGLSGLGEVQIVQEAPERVVVHVVPGSGYGDEVRDALVSALTERLGTSVRIEVRTVEVIARSKRGKFRAVIRQFDP